MPDTTALDIDTFHQWRQRCFYPKADLPLPDQVLRGERAAPLPAEADIAQACAYALGEPVIVESLTAGTFHRLWRVLRLNGDPLIFRANVWPDWFRDFALALDGPAGEKLRKAGLPSLNVHRVDWSRQRCATDFAIVDEAPGTALRELDNDEARLLPMLNQLGRFFAKQHRIRLEGYGLLDVRGLASGSDQTLRGGHAAWDDFLWLNLERHVRDCVAIGAITEEEGRKIIWYCESCRGLYRDGPPVLLHGDPGSHNVFVLDGQVSALIDWEDALAGDPVFEIAFWATFHPERRHAAFIDGYRDEAQLPGDFELRFWLYFMRVALAKTVLRHRLGIKDQPGREPAALRIRKALAKLIALGR